MAKPVPKHKFQAVILNLRHTCATLSLQEPCHRLGSELGWAVATSRKQAGPPQGGLSYTCWFLHSTNVYWEPTACSCGRGSPCRASSQRELGFPRRPSRMVLSCNPAPTPNQQTATRICLKLGWWCWERLPTGCGLFGLCLPNAQCPRPLSSGHENVTTAHLMLDTYHVLKLL